MRPWKACCMVAVFSVAVASTGGGCSGPRTGEPLPAPSWVDVMEAAHELGMAVERDPVSQALVLTDEANRVVVCPGVAEALVNGAFVELGAPARFHEGRLVIPVEGLRRVTARLKARPARSSPGRRER